VEDGAATAVGDSAAVVVDGRQAHWTTGGGAIGGAWIIVDSFVDAQAVTP
jgi:hypothetical protein